MSRKQKKTLARILVSGVLFGVAVLAPVQGWQKLLLCLVPYGIIGWDVLWKAVRNIFRGQVFDENFLMALATVGAFFTGEYPEGVAVMPVSYTHLGLHHRPGDQRGRGHGLRPAPNITAEEQDL